MLSGVFDFAEATGGLAKGKDELESLIAVQVPRFYFAGTPEEASPDGARADSAGALCVRSRVMREFVGMEDVDEATQHALIDFSYHLTIGNMDEVCSLARSRVV